MPPLRLRNRNRYGETVTVNRVIRDASGDTTVALPPVANTAFGKEVQQMISDDDSMRGRRVVVETTWFCPRSADVRKGDRITRPNGDIYTVMSDAFGNVNHPMSGVDLGVKRYLVRIVQVPRG